MVRHVAKLLAIVSLLTATLLAQPAAAADQEFGTLACRPGTVVWITERTSAGVTTIAWNGHTSQIVKQAWSTTRTRTGLRSTWWRVHTTGLMDHAVTRAFCER